MSHKFASRRLTSSSSLSTPYLFLAKNLLFFDKIFFLDTSKKALQARSVSSSHCFILIVIFLRLPLRSAFENTSGGLLNDHYITIYLLAVFFKTSCDLHVSFQSIIRGSSLVVYLSFLVYNSFPSLFFPLFHPEQVDLAQAAGLAYSARYNGLHTGRPFTAITSIFVRSTCTRSARLLYLSLHGGTSEALLTH